MQSELVIMFVVFIGYAVLDKRKVTEPLLNFSRAQINGEFEKRYSATFLFA
jgi:hypothetical protein